MTKFICTICNKPYIKKTSFEKHQTTCSTLQSDNKLIISETRPTKPILKWVGGKTQIISHIMSKVPTTIENYHEIFLGGGSVLLAMLCYIQQGIIHVKNKIYAYDLNEPLIYLYKNIQTDPEQFYSEIQQIIAQFENCKDDPTINRKAGTLNDAMLNKENYYYWIRELYNALSANDKKTYKGSAMFLFLNKTCFRGVFRMGPRGFNVPYGHYNTPEIINREHLQEVHNLIQPVIFECCDFTASIANVAPGDYMYLDPPYAPETTTSFVGYTDKGFGIDMHTSLFNIIHAASARNVKIMMSNADVELVHDSFNDSHYITTTIECRRAINQKNPESKTNEVIIINY